MKVQKTLCSVIAKALTQTLWTELNKSSENTFYYCEQKAEGEAKPSYLIMPDQGKKKKNTYTLILQLSYKTNLFEFSKCEGPRSATQLV